MHYCWRISFSISVNLDLLMSNTSLPHYYSTIETEYVSKHKHFGAFFPHYFSTIETSGSCLHSLKRSRPFHTTIAIRLKPPFYTLTRINSMCQPPIMLLFINALHISKPISFEYLQSSKTQGSCDVSILSSLINTPPSIYQLVQADCWPLFSSLHFSA